MIRELSIVEELEENFHSKISAVKKQLAKYEETIEEMKNSSPQLNVLDSLLLGINDEKEKLEIEYNKLLIDLNTAESKIRNRTKNELVYRTNTLKVENRKLLQKKIKLLRADKRCKINWKIAKDNCAARKNINKKLMAYLELKEKRIKKFETENQAQIETLKCEVENYRNESGNFKEK